MLRRAFIGLLVFLRVVDREDRVVSLTNLGLIILLGKLAAVPRVELPDLAAFFLALLAYSYKRAANNKKVSEGSDSPPIIAPVADVAGEVAEQIKAATAPLLSKVKDLEAFVSTVKLGGGLGGRRG